jgi:hypothetical protein
MPPSFDWEFDDDPEPTDPPETDSSSSDRRRRRLRRGAVLLLVLLALGSGVRALINARDRAVTQVEADLRATVELELHTIATGDVELFEALQDPADATWRSRQKERYFGASGTSYVPAPGMALAERAAEIKAIDLKGASGQVQITQWYEFPAQGASPGPLARPEQSETRQQQVAAQQIPTGTTLHAFTVTWTYRRTDEGDWHHVAEEQAAWREPYYASAGVRKLKFDPSDPTARRTIRLPGMAAGSFITVPLPNWAGPVLQIQATQAEAAILAPITVELGRTVADACDLLQCPYIARHSLNFGDVPVPQIDGRQWSLPTLYLAGMPDDVAARDAWLHALKLWIVEALARAQIDEASVSPNPASASQHDRFRDGAAPRELAARPVFRAFVLELKAYLGLIEPAVLDMELLRDAVASGRQHGLDALWQADLDGTDPEEARLLETEAVALLDMLIEQIGPEESLGLLPELFQRPGALDLEAIYDLDWESPSQTWFAYLSQLTGEPIVPLSAFPIIPAGSDNINPLALSPVRALSPGDQIALVCDSRIWVGQANGDDLIPLTPRNEDFSSPSWSSDGRWLLVRRIREDRATSSDGNSGSKPSAGLSDDTSLSIDLALIDTKDGEGDTLVSGRVEELRFLRFSPDSELVIYETATDIRALAIEQGETRRLPGRPVWSPNGKQMVFASGEPRRPWLAEADWGIPRQVAHYPGLAWPETLWSPGNRILAMNLNRGFPFLRTIAVYDLKEQQIADQIELYDLIKALASSDGHYVGNGAEPTGTDFRSQRWIWSQGWSADGSHLLVGGQWTKGLLGELDFSLLVALPVGTLLDDSRDRTSDPETTRGSARVVAYGRETFFSNIAWSPTDPERLIFKWRVSTGVNPRYDTHLFDLKAGSLFSASDVVRAAWAPDGSGVALVRADRFAFVDGDGRERFSFETPGACTDIAWNPASDLGDLAAR